MRKGREPIKFRSLAVGSRPPTLRQLAPVSLGPGALSLGRGERQPTVIVFVLAIGCAVSCAVGQQVASPAGKEASVFFPTSLVTVARENAARYAWAAELREGIVRAAEPWVRMSDEDLWGLMFGNTIRRSWMVWSSGYCPACKVPVPMYNWKVDALAMPWKVECPSCHQRFPTNDFAAFYRSGLDAHGIFDPARADRALLFNSEHPDPADPLHSFGVDDGEGYVEGEKRWRFIGAYLIYGQWKQAVLGGIKALSAAYVVTGDPVYARKAGILLDRVADVYPTFDFRTEGVMYEGPAHAGYVSTWHDACEEVRELALAYDQVFEALRTDVELAGFLAGKARQYGLENPKATPADVCRNIEERILWDTLQHPEKIVSNYPRREVALIVIKSVLGWPGNREDVLSHMDSMIHQATAVDGVTGEKGLDGYAAFTVAGLAQFLAEWTRAAPTRLREILERHPQLRQTFRFHIDTWCLQQYYPRIGDTGVFARRSDQYAGMYLTRPGRGGTLGVGALAPSMFSFLWRLYQETGDVAYVQVMYRGNGDSVEGLPHDLFAADPTAVQAGVSEVIGREGPTIRLGSVNKQQWHLAILRSGEGKSARATWLAYDAGGGHGHFNGMTLGLFAKGLDLMPDLGYPPVQFGGWSGPRFSWYVSSLSHNTVVVDGANHRAAAGQTTLWADGDQFRLVRASGFELTGGQQFERTVACVDISPRDFYVLDVFRVVGGKDHAWFMNSAFATLATQGLNLAAGEPYGNTQQMRGFQWDPHPRPGWWADWTIEDRLGYLPPGAEVHLRYIGLTSGAQADVAESWVAPEGFSSHEEAWIPRLMVRRQEPGEDPLASAFVGVIEPYEHTPLISHARRLPLTTVDGTEYPDGNVAVEVSLVDGRSDLFITADVENPLNLSPAWKPGVAVLQPDWSARLVGEACFVRREATGAVSRVALCRAQEVQVGHLTVALQGPAEYLELEVTGDGARVVAGSRENIQEIVLEGRRLEAR